MPISLPPISRRRFLSRSLAAFGGLSIGTELLARSAEPSASSWALLSDPHLAADPKLVARRVNVTATEGKVILSGNVRSWAERQEAERAAWAAPGVSQVDDRLSVVP